ncbi:MAG: ABC transporter substrate-binding protein [Streptosporangiaceae bacterium]|nr:ABC transporter substrate-binding protein [Streptosporangiaceae bacterium]MBV9854079.1 ABC transporter substrate-binding protein [Streptosporangiaceae bacterium]
MISMSKRIAGLTMAAVAAAGGLAACSSSASSSGPAASSAKPVMGGTLRIVAASGPDHIDTVPAYYTADYQLEHAYTRQLVQYPTQAATSISSSGWNADVTPVADMATEVPTTANGGITNGGKTYTFHIKPGVDWNTTPPRPVTSQDFVREFKAFFNPVSPVGNPVYYTSAIAGLANYDSQETAYFANAKTHPPTAANIANFQNTHSISGIATPNSSTIQFTLTSAATDFVYMLAMPFASARPVEYDSYVPNSLQLDQHTISDGPYQISSYIPGKSITLVRNPAWKQSTDPLRHDYVNQIVLTEGVTSAETQLSDMQAGTQDVINDTPLNAASIPSLESSHSPNFFVFPWSTTQPYLVFNLRSPDANGAAGKLLVRQAVEYGLDKVAVQKAYGGPTVATIINSAIPPGNVGYQNYNLYPDNNGAGNVAMCKSDLSKAGYPNGLSLVYMYPNDSSNTRAFTAIQASLAACGIHLQGKPEPGSTFFTDMGNAPENNKPNQFDIGQAAWVPDWFGNNGRTIIQALFQGPNCVVNTVNYGCYDNSQVNSLITQAESATSLSAAGAAWHQADVDIMKDAAIVPIVSQNFPQYSSARVKGIGYQTAMFAPNIGAPDITNLWISGS